MLITSTENSNVLLIAIFAQTKFLMSKKKKKAKNHRNNEITKGIFTVLEKEPKKSFNYKQIASQLGLNNTQDRNQLIKRLGQLKEKKRIHEEERGRFKAV